MTQTNKVDVLIVGGGPAGLSAAIRLKQLLNERGRSESVAVIDKADKPGQHILSGLVFEPQVLDDLIPDWKERTDPFVTRALNSEVRQDDTLFLTKSRAIKLPEWVVPPYLRHRGNLVLSGSEMVRWLVKEAQALGVRFYTGFAGVEVLYGDSGILGVRLGDKGLDREGKPQVNFVPGEAIEAKVTVLAEGSLGQLAEDVVEKKGMDEGRIHQIHSLGVKEAIKLPPDHSFGENHVVHTFGFPLADVFGGGTIYSVDKNTVVVALVLALDWKYADLNPQQELQVFKSHPYVAGILEGGEVIAYGAKTLPEGGYFALPRPYTDGALIVGDDAGFTDVRKLKGWHNAMRSGLLAGQAVMAAIERDDFSAATLQLYGELLEASPVIADLKRGKNYRQMFTKGRTVYLGAPLSLIQGLIPLRLKTEPDHQGTRRVHLKRDYRGGHDRLSDVALSGTIHREEEPSHIRISDPDGCAACFRDYGVHPCAYFCPADVYRFEDHELILNSSNCVHCQTCRTKCPHQVIRWRVPEGGGGPKYKVM
jgi:electron-transferring-flavoprotein dehydrogenase